MRVWWIVPLVVASGCDATDLVWRVAADDSAIREDTVTLVARVRRGGCRVTDEVVYEQTVRAGVVAPPRLDPGDWGFEAEAFDACCRSIGIGCELVALPSEAGDVVTTVRSGAPLPPCAPAVDECGPCGPIECPPDAGPPNPDAGPDAGGMDAGPTDSGICVPSSEVCNGLDDDCNGVVDDNGDFDGDGVHECDDCDDSDEMNSPAFAEVCGDMRDNDCSGAPESAAECCPPGTTWYAPYEVCLSGPQSPATCESTRATCLAMGSCPNSPPSGTCGTFLMTEGSDHCSYCLVDTMDRASCARICGGSETGCAAVLSGASLACPLPFYCGTRALGPRVLGGCSQDQDCGRDQRCDDASGTCVEVMGALCCHDDDCSGGAVCELSFSNIGSPARAFRIGHCSP